MGSKQGNAWAIGLMLLLLTACGRALHPSPSGAEGAEGAEGAGQRDEPLEEAEPKGTAVGRRTCHFVDGFEGAIDDGWKGTRSQAKGRSGISSLAVATGTTVTRTLASCSRVELWFLTERSGWIEWLDTVIVLKTADGSEVGIAPAGEDLVVGIDGIAIGTLAHASGTWAHLVVDGANLVLESGSQSLNETLTTPGPFTEVALHGGRTESRFFDDVAID